MKKKNQRLRNTVIAFFVILSFAILIELQITWILTKNSANKSTTLLLNQVETVLEDNEKTEETHAEELKETYISYAKTIGFILSAKPEMINDIDELKEIAAFQNVDEIHIFDETGTIVAGTVPKYYGYNFDSGEQMAYFKPMLKDKSLAMCQDVTPNTAEGKSMMYAIAWNQDGTQMIQVGIEPKRLLAELEENDIENVINNIPLIDGFDIFVIDSQTYEVISSTNRGNISSEQFSTDLKKIKLEDKDSNNGIVGKAGKSFYYNYKKIGDYYVVTLYSMNKSTSNMVVPLIIIAIYIGIAGIVILRLFTKLYKSEAEKEEQVHRLEEEEDIIRAAGHGIWRCPIDASGHVTGMIGNEEWKRIFGVENIEMTPTECLQFFVDGLANPLDDPSKLDYSNLDNGVIIHMTFPWKHSVKGTIYIEIAGAKHIGINGDIQVSGYAADMTEETLAKQKWEKEIVEAREKAEAADKAKTSFLFNMSHDIRTPMNAIMGFTDLMEKHYDDKEKCMDYLKKTQDANKFLLSLINNVLEMARIESGKEQLDETVCLAGSIAREMVSIFDDQMSKKNISFINDIDVKCSTVLCDQSKIREIYLNILSNALKYTPAGGKISMRVKELPSSQTGYGMFKLVFEDTGIGMSKEFLPHLFEEFTRAKTATESRQQGTGLGMPIVKKLVDLMGGTIEVESELGKGSIFTVTLSLRIVDTLEDKESNISDSLTHMDITGKRILLAEDNDLNAEIAEEILKDIGFEVERAEDGVICVDMLQKAECGYYDLILMDIQMPNMDGYKAAQTIRALKDSCRNQIPIVAMTANAFESDKKDAFAAGMNGHIAKPIEISKLMQTISNVLNDEDSMNK